ncbi:MAG: SHOCT domain-containing protein [Bacteroidales bacterium]|nr:SHOCT domain-containing protein [Bacteroidales bacterium]MDZ4203210.1 SHOCT domain-containing protein [Bacteroidales bacterium]
MEGGSQVSPLQEAKCAAKARYKPARTYELFPYQDQQQLPQQKHTDIKSKADRLRELKQLLDEKLITQADYEKEKKKILDDDEK